MKTCAHCDKPLDSKSKKFCNNSCSAKHNNKRFPKRKPEGECRVCKKPINSYRNWCSEECKRTKPEYKKCSRCGTAKHQSEFYNGRSTCSKCFNIVCVERVAKNRRSKKLRLLEAHGWTCVDCGITGPPYLLDFDHREPDKKSFTISKEANHKSYAALYEESLKCDLVCANCHRHRTHKQRCLGCEFCTISTKLR